uniref:Uncharacterized protein n=1 Tax=Solanum tuberosum TaxID=4113 RepID=M1DHV1_SOLTU
MDTNLQKERSELKERRNEGLVIAKSLWRVAEWPPSRLKFQCACRRVVLRCSIGSPKVTELEDAEGQRKKAIDLTKGQIAKPDLLRQMVLCSIFLATINTFSNI